MGKIEVEDYTSPIEIAVEKGKRAQHERAMKLAMEAIGDHCVGVVLIAVTEEGKKSRASMGIGLKTSLSEEGQAKAESILLSAAEFWFEAMRGKQ